MAEKAQKLESYVWEGKDRKGNKAKGELTGSNLALVKAQLRKQGIIPDKVKKKPKPLFGGKKKITPFDIAMLTRQLATMMKAGVPLVQSFDIVADGLENKGLQELVMSIRNDISSGTGFASALRKHPRHFDDLYCNLVESGEKAGALEQMLDRIATYLEKTELLKKKVKKAMTYPIAVIVVAIVVTAILLVKVVPQFESLFQGFGAELPVFTQMVVRLSEWMQSWWFVVLLGIVGVIFTFKEAKRRSPKFSDFVDKYTLKLPVVGEILDKSAVAKFGRVLSTTFAAGVPLVDALDSVAGATGNAVYRDAVMRIKNDVSSGTQLQASMRQQDVFPVMAVQLTAIGEESGNLDEMLGKVAEHYEAVVDDMVDNLTALMEPMIMSVLGVLVGGLIVAMYLPIFQMGQVVG
ncbi:MAG TPA: type II secretion system protein F [Marinobacter hydrocarbonoclasticus]|uniref:type II secretion system F family protein n=1 Tax=unclassified Marinobacter TaxID=83889 RepID=UPI000C60B228|nr:MULTISPECIES: type II secretion system F family protein [unclassified Marinobacter]MCG8523350.1 type II secretion system F family protein [Pseudomonadales bacterium]HCL38567.1 type II secretion system protein F [Marinobacter nauticus]MAC23613.1 type II secretion system protein F [Marinobacter sp.]MBH92683.1 type II secretion system protein F [Marinobacter sp.]HCR46060.1 type II secretion system protein F [Marinobacter nauticus]|tara:strand:+ start:246 stop:1466 length:1221 start_codon:yes stop_codon:yes gene_type:complete